jgi:hypothetical protein
MRVENEGNGNILYFVDRASRYNSLLMTKLTHFLYLYLLHLYTCFEHQVLIIRRWNYINTSSGMISLCECLLGMPVRRALLTGITKQSLTQTNHTR